MKKILAVCGVVVVLAVVAVFLLIGNLNTIIKNGIENVGPEKLKVTTAVEKVEVSYFSGTGTISGLTISNPEGYQSEYAFKMDLLHIELDVNSVKSEKIRIKELVIDAPEITFEGDFNNNNFAQIGKNAQKSKEKKQKKVQIDSLKIENAKIHLVWKQLPDKKFTIPLKSLEVKDIGKDGTTNTSGAIKQVLEQVRNKILPAIKKEISKYSNKIKEVGKSHIEKIKEKMKKKPPFKKPPFEKEDGFKPPKPPFKKKENGFKPPKPPFKKKEDGFKPPFD